ncbi:MAG TPA: HD domain-containing phosphohydrolase [Gemmatimonadaceae bacterium]|jgi:putative two-component system response regulator
MISILNRRKPRLLIVDDEPADVLLLQRLLAGSGLEPISTTDPTEAVELFLSLNPDLLILALNKAGMNGFDVLAALKLVVSPERFPSVLVITGDNSAATRKRALSVGAKDFITKPFDSDDVRLRIGNLLETAELHQALREQNAVLASTLRDQTIELEEARIESVVRLALVAELRDDVTGQHNARVARMACAIAEAIGPDSDSAQLLGRVAALHDIGKIGIPDRILLKTGPLSASEWDTMKTHTTIGARILSSGRSEFMHLGMEIAQSHHERWDGGGYPDGLCGTRIPLAARIVTIADVFDALSSDRPYRPAYTVEESCEAIERGSHTLFDPSLVKIFRAVFPVCQLQEERESGERRVRMPDVPLKLLA